MKRRRVTRAGTSGGAGSMPPGAASDPMEDLRRRIDALDRKMVALLNDRAECAIALGRIKQARGLPIYQPAREEEVLGNVQRTNGGPLRAEAMRRLFERIIDESRRIERVATEKDPPPIPGREMSREPARREDSED
jgi:chorismate mutase